MSDQGIVDQELAQQLVDRARAEGVKLTGPGGLLGDLTPNGSSRPVWKVRWTATLATRSTPSRDTMVATRVTARGPKR